MNRKFISGIMIFLTTAFTIFAQVKSRDGMVTVKAEADGLHITKKHAVKFEHVNIHILGENGENLQITTDQNQNEFVYPFVTAGKKYSVYLTMFDAGWGSFTQSKNAEITAAGGEGDYSISIGSYSYDNNQTAVVCEDVKIKIPEAEKNVPGTMRGLIYYDQGNSIDWSKVSWASAYPCKIEGNRLIIDISGKLNYFAATKFFPQMDYIFSSKGITFSFPLISDNSKRFTDNHFVTDIEVSDGVLFPVFNPAVKYYKIRGTENAVQLKVSGKKNMTLDKSEYVISPENKKISVTAGNGDNFLTYNFEYEITEKKNFNGKDYLLTFADDFDGEELDFTKWNRSPEEERQGSMENHGYWRNDCSYLDGNGNLVIEARRENNQNISGAIDTEGIFTQSHGLYEIRFKCEKTSGLWYAFWLLGQNDDAHIGNGAVDAAELDIFELIPNEQYNGPNYFKTTVLWDGYGKSQKGKDSGKYNLKDDFYDQWHTVQYEWGDESYKFYLDGNFMWEIKGKNAGGMCQGKNHLIISSEFGSWGGPLKENLLPAKMYVDWVKVWK